MIIPNYIISGILALLVGLCALVWSAVLIQLNNGGLASILLSILMLTVCRGFD